MVNMILTHILKRFEFMISWGKLNGLEGDGFYLIAASSEVSFSTVILTDIGKSSGFS
jgi:hypothetical protein